MENWRICKFCAPSERILEMCRLKSLLARRGRGCKIATATNQCLCPRVEMGPRRTKSTETRHRPALANTQLFSERRPAEMEVFSDETQSRIRPSADFCRASNARRACSCDDSGNMQTPTGSRLAVHNSARNNWKWRQNSQGRCQSQDDCR
jgi:hypothetical protein